MEAATRKNQKITITRELVDKREMILERDKKEFTNLKLIVASFEFNDHETNRLTYTLYDYIPKSIFVTGTGADGLSEAVQLVTELNPHIVFEIGHADYSGDDLLYNLKSQELYIKEVKAIEQ